MQNNEMKSNINIASNVYIRTENSEYQDVAYIEQITGYNALLKMSTRAKSASVKINLTYAQEQELVNSIPCTNLNNKLCEQTFGAVKIDNEIVWSCRCENVDCVNYQDCMALPNSKRIDRNYINLDGIIDNSDKKNDNELIIDEALFIEHEEKNEIPEKQLVGFHFEDTAFNYKKIGDITEIVRANVNDHILVNASSVSGKTFTLIKKLEHIIENNLIKDLSKILVLCYAKSTQNYIITSLPEKGKQIKVCTLDSYATQLLSQIGEEFYELSYDERVELFNNKITELDFSDIQLVMIDELQDLQNGRAMMILNILKKINCGSFLLGDKCQALYQETENISPVSIDVVRLYNLLNKVMPRNTTKYELISNYTQNDELKKIAKTIRDALLYKNLVQAKKIMAKEFENIEVEYTVVEKIKPILKSNETLAFLCRSDSEAEFVSSVLYKNKIPHNLLRNLPNKYSFNRFIADVLWDHCSENITKEDFIQRYVARISENIETAEKMFDLLLNFSKEYGEENENLKINKTQLLMKFLNGKEPPVEFTNKNDRQITVSTVAKSKSEKFDNVYLVDFEIENLTKDSIKLDKLHEIYVAIIRSKNSVKLINFKNRLEFKTTKNQRTYRTYKKYNKEYCTHFSIGDDIAIECFICGNFKDVLLGQKYLSEVVRVNDKIELILRDNSYHIYHIQNTRTSRKITQHVGVISNEAFDDFKDAITSYNDGILPNRLYDLYISQVVTVPQNIHLDNVSTQFKRSKFTIGIEISGFAKLDWNA